MDKFSEIIFETITDAINIQPHKILDLIKTLNSNCKDLETEMYLILPTVLSLVEATKNMNNIDVSIMALQTLRGFSATILDDHLHLLIPTLLRICCGQIVQKNEKYEHLIKETLATLDSLKECRNTREYVANIIHQLIQVYETSGNMDIL